MNTLDNITDWSHLEIKLILKCFKRAYYFQQCTWVYIGDTFVFNTKWPFKENIQHAEWVSLVKTGVRQLNNAIDLKKKIELSRNSLLAFSQRKTSNFI